MKSSRTKPRRSTRSSVSANPSASDKDSARVTPSPTEIDPDSSDEKQPKKRKSSALKTEKKVTSPYFDKKKSPDGEKSDLAADSDDENEADSGEPLPASKRKKTNKSDSKGVAAKRKSVESERKKESKDDTNETSLSKSAPAKKPSPKKKSSSNSANNASSDSTGGGVPDGNGGLNQPAPFNVEYSKSSRATCRTCDEIIKKGDVRVGHTPLFRGKVSYACCLVVLFFEELLFSHKVSISSC